MEHAHRTEQHNNMFAENRNNQQVIEGDRVLVTLQETVKKPDRGYHCSCRRCRTKRTNEYAQHWYPLPCHRAKQGVLFADVDTTTGAVHNIDMPKLEELHWTTCFSKLIWETYGF